MHLPAMLMQVSCLGSQISLMRADSAMPGAESGQGRQKAEPAVQHPSHHPQGFPSVSTSFRSLSLSGSQSPECPMSWRHSPSPRMSELAIGTFSFASFVRLAIPTVPRIKDNLPCASISASGPRISVGEPLGLACTVAGSGEGKPSGGCHLQGFLQLCILGIMPNGTVSKIVPQSIAEVEQCLWFSNFPCLCISPVCYLVQVIFQWKIVTSPRSCTSTILGECLVSDSTILFPLDHYDRVFSRKIYFSMIVVVKNK